MGLGIGIRGLGAWVEDLGWRVQGFQALRLCGSVNRLLRKIAPHGLENLQSMRHVMNGVPNLRTHFQS